MGFSRMAGCIAPVPWAPEKISVILATARLTAPNSLSSAWRVARREFRRRLRQRPTRTTTPHSPEALLCLGTVDHECAATVHGVDQAAFPEHFHRPAHREVPGQSGKRMS